MIHTRARLVDQRGAATGAQQWRFHAKSDPKGTTFNACRGVTYFVDAAAAAARAAAGRTRFRTIVWSKPAKGCEAGWGVG